MALQSPAPVEARHEADGNGHSPKASNFWLLTLGSIGVVYGDIGTSPLYAFREAVRAASDDGQASQDEVLGVLSLIFWALTIVVTLKYVVFLLRADNRGEGGTLALMALAQRAVKNSGFVVLLGIIAAALFYGDAMLTPALSVLSAVEGLNVVTPGLEPYVLPISIAILVALFLVQSRGTGLVSALFGPVTFVWFIALALLGLMHIGDNPVVLLALSPTYAVGFFVSHGLIGLVTLGAVFLAVTGAEALYADLGHFGRRPIQFAWLALVFPALVINYFGQGALVLAHPETISNPFFLMSPSWAQLPMVFLATAATVIASQAVITGAFSLSRQAVQLGLLPRLEIRHTSQTQAGQIYLPRINIILLIGVLLLVGLFGTSTALASAYGIAVSGTMVVTGIMAFIVVRRSWGWSVLAAVSLVIPFLVIDIIFFGANLLKIADGGWFPMLLGFAVVTLMLTWRRGSRILFEKTRRSEVPLIDLVENLEKHSPPRVAGTAVYLTGDPDSTPTALLHALKHFKVLHERNLILTVVTTEDPKVDPDDRVRLESISPTFMRLTLRYGFMETPHVPKSLGAAKKLGWTFDIMSTSFFFSRRNIVPAAKSAMPIWQDRIFMLLTRNADDAASYFRVPTDRVVEIGTQVAM